MGALLPRRPLTHCQIPRQFSPRHVLPHGPPHTMVLQTDKKTFILHGNGRRSSPISLGPAQSHPSRPKTRTPQRPLTHTHSCRPKRASHLDMLRPQLHHTPQHLPFLLPRFYSTGSGQTLLHHQPRRNPHQHHNRLHCLHHGYLESPLFRNQRGLPMHNPSFGQRTCLPRSRPRLPSRLAGHPQTTLLS
jgi:hypothetical protein